MVVPNVFMSVISRWIFLFRAPEVSLGLPFTEAIDVWGLGCVLLFLYVGDNFFSVTSEYQMVRGSTVNYRQKVSGGSEWMFCLQMRHIVELLGQPEDRLLLAGQYSEKFFIQDETAEGETWRLMVKLPPSRILLSFFLKHTHLHFVSSDCRGIFY